MKNRIKQVMLAMVLWLFLSPMAVNAASTTAEMSRFPGVTTSPDGSNTAWTTDYGDKADERLPEGYTIDMGVESTLRPLNIGEHYYKTEAVGSVPIGKWVVTHSPGQCIHDTPTKDHFAGFDFRNENCHSYYNNGWFMYCADCEELVYPMLMYGKEETMQGITSVPASSVYAYLCPYCRHLEQGTGYQHMCKAISDNHYRVVYRSNAPSDVQVAGYMSPTFHMYNNSTEYNGRPASEFGYTDTKLKQNTFSAQGYIFTGWNTKADGSGQSLADGQEILNLTGEENGVVRLYAQWQKAESTLVIDAEGGAYKGQALFEQRQKYNSEYKVDSGLLSPPAGYRVSFVTNGGAAVADITTTKSFSYWELGTDFQGQFTDDIYTYTAENGHKDTLKARYLNNDFILPDCSNKDASLVGWYDSPELKDEDYVGRAGERVSVSKDTVLYAEWAQLTLWAYDDYESYNGTGAVDLKWEQKDGKSKYYRLYQSMDKNSWKEIFEADVFESNFNILKGFDVSHKGAKYTIPYTGNYTLTAKGGNGADYNGALVGGKGGSTAATYWLFKGDVITVYPGSSGNGQMGGSNGSSASGGSSASELGRGGGAASLVYVTRNGTRTLLLAAGGGGGANGYYSGGAGGTGGGNGTNSNGANGIGGGGGGKTGGIAGVAEVHNHTISCRHVHSGSPGTYGGCYTIVQPCGSTSFEHTETEMGFYYGNIEYVDGEWVHVFCVRCGSDDCDGHAIIEHEYRCNWCGAVYGSDSSSCTAKTGYGLGCGRDESYICGYSEGQIIKVASAAGGTNYIAEVFGCKNQSSQSGINHGDGTVSISSKDAGYLETNKLNDVVARDKAAPDRILSAEGALSGDKRYRVTVEEPKDSGTLYYHKAESYESGTINRVAVSNVTENLLTSGIAGYHYYVDGNSGGTVSVGHAFISDNKLDISMKNSVQYLHIAAVDKAGNIGPANTILIPSYVDTADKDVVVDYIKTFPPMTDMLVLKLSEAVYEIAPGRFFVKADGVTEHTIAAGAYLEGSATSKYQIDVLRLVSSSGADSEWYETVIPRSRPDAGNKVYYNEELMANASGEELNLLQMTRAEAARTDEARVIGLTQHMTIEPELDGREITIYPRARAEFEGKEYFSDLTVDRTHGIILVPDGKAPDIYGVEALENAGNIDMTEQEKQFVIYAADEGSGVKNLIVTVTNMDNGMVRTYESDTGSVTITMSREDYLFLGDFVVTAEAADNVDNHSVMGSDKAAFTLEADIRRSREPYDGDYKAGDGAVLTVTTGGYADKVIIRFPDALLALNPGLNKEYVYEFPYAIRTEVYEFNIPLGTPDSSYVIEIEAWKNGLKLTEALDLSVVKAGSITEELRTRIRDNGV